MEEKPRSAARDNMGWLLGAILIALGAAALANQFIVGFGDVIWAIIFGGVGAAFFALSMRSPSNWWAMIPGYVFVVIAAIILLSMVRINGEFIGVFVVTAIGVPFLYVYIRDRRHWWALIPAYTMFVVAGIIWLSMFKLHGTVIPTYVMFAIALPFYYVFLRNRENWWALIPAGIMSLVGLGLFTASFPYILPIALIGSGVVLLLWQFGRKESTNTPELPKTGPGADKPRSA